MCIDYVVVVECYDVVCFQFLGVGFVDVVQQCGDVQWNVGCGFGVLGVFEFDCLVEDGEGVFVYVFVVVVFVDFEVQFGDFGQEFVDQVGVDQYVDVVYGVVCLYEVYEFGLDVFGIYDFQGFVEFGDCFGCCFFDVEVELGVEMCCLQYLQWVVVE